MYSSRIHPSETGSGKVFSFHAEYFSMHGVYTQLAEWLRQGKHFVCCRLIETRGSTPQKPGAAMLVLPDGSQYGTLGGGCVEAEVKRRALDSDTRPFEMLRFELDNDYGWDDGLICGGRMHVLVERLAGDIDEYFQILDARSQSGQGALVVTVYDENPWKIPVGATWLLTLDSSSKEAGSSPSHFTVLAVRNGAPLAIPEPLLVQISENTRARKPAAWMGIAWYLLPERARLVIFGGGHVGQAVAALASDLDFDVLVCDDRAEYVTEERFPQAKARLHGPLEQILPPLTIDQKTYCLIVTRGHNHDEQVLSMLIRRVPAPAYLGMIGSKRKIRLIFDDLLDHGVDPALLTQVYAPVGIDIGSQTVPEIAVSIAAELVAHRNLQGRVPGRPEPVYLGC